MAIKIFLDTNIILDIIDDKRFGHLDSKKIFKLLEAKKLLGFITESIITNADYILKKEISKKIRRDFFSELNNLLEILPFSSTIFTLAFQSSNRGMEDAIIYQIALQNKIDFFITNDSELSQKLSSKSLPVISSEQFIKQF